MACILNTSNCEQLPHKKALTAAMPRNKDKFCQESVQNQSTSRYFSHTLMFLIVLERELKRLRRKGTVQCFKGQENVKVGLGLDFSFLTFPLLMLYKKPQVRKRS